MNNYIKFYVVSGVVLLVLMGVLYTSVLGQKVISPDQLTTEQEVKDTFLTRIVSKIADIDKGTLIFEYNCIFDNCFIGQDLKESIYLDNGRDLRETKYYYETIENVSIPYPEITPQTCNVNGTDYNCDEVEILYDYEDRQKWNLINFGTTLVKGIYNIKAIVSYEPGTGQQSIDWIPIIDLKKSRYPEIANDITAEKTTWEWFNSSWYNCRNITIGSGNNTPYQNALIYDLNLTNLTFISDFQIRIVNAACNDSGTSQHYQIWDSGSDWIDIMFYANLTTNTTYSVYYNNTNATDQEFTDPIASRPDLFAFNYTCINKFSSINMAAITRTDHIEIYHFATAAGGNIACMYDNNATTKGTLFNTDELNNYFYKAYTNTSSGGNSRGCPLSDACDSGVVEYYPSWQTFNTVLNWGGPYINTSISLAQFDRIRFSTMSPGGGNSYVFLYDMVFCKDCNVSDLIEAQEQNETFAPPPIPPAPETNVTLVINIDTSEALQSETRRICIDNNTLQVDSLIYRCVGAEEDDPFCFWSNTSRFEYCQTGCINDSNQLGGQCAYTDFETTLIGVAVFLISIAMIYWLFRRR